MAESGIVYLVGAGPGDPGLLTLRGKECLEKADVVVYDQLANPEFLGYAPANAEMVYVGKKAAQHTMRQENINALLVRKGLEGKVVVRLKGGDPYVFGRGGEEAWELQQAGVRFEVVPGITSGIAAPAYAGIPVTHRDCNTVLSIITGHEDPTKTDSSIDWDALAKGGGTLAFYMGVGNLPHIAEKLIAGGRSPQTPVALVRYGTLPAQQVVQGTLADIAAKVKSVGLRPPAITVVGEVVRLREQLQWFDNRPLFGRRILTTSLHAGSGNLVAGLREAGADVLPFSTLNIAPPDDDGPLKRVAWRLEEFDWIVFDSVASVDALFAAIEANGGDARWLAPCRLAATGTPVVHRLLDKGVHPDLVPERMTSESLLTSLMNDDEVSGRHFLLLRGDDTRAQLPHGLRDGGATTEEIVAYRAVLAPPAENILDALREGEVDMIAFTNSAAVRNYATMMREALGQLPAGIGCGSIGPETSDSIVAEGMSPVFEAKEHTIPGMIAALVNHFKEIEL